MRNAAWRGDDVFLDCTNPRLSLRGDIAACAWRLCSVKRAAICLEIYAGDCVVYYASDCVVYRLRGILPFFWRLRGGGAWYITHAVYIMLVATIVGDCLREGPVKTVC